MQMSEISMLPALTFSNCTSMCVHGEKTRKAGRGMGDGEGWMDQRERMEGE